MANSYFRQGHVIPLHRKHAWMLNMLRSIHLRAKPVAVNWMLVCVATIICVSMCRCSVRAIMGARHDHEIVRDDIIHVHLDHKHIGSGGDDSWSPSVHKVLYLLVAFTSTMLWYAEQWTL